MIFTAPVVEQGGARLVDTRIEYSAVNKGRRSARILIQVVCQAQQVRVLKSESFRASDLEDRISEDNQPSAWQAPRAGSILAVAITPACRNADSTQAAASPAPEPSVEPKVSPPLIAMSPAQSAHEAADFRAAYRPAPTPGPMPVPTASSGEHSAPHAAFRAQLGAFSTSEVAATEAERLSRRLSKVLDGRSVGVEKALLNGAAVFRLTVVGVEDRSSALATCTSLKATGQPCLVVERPFH